MATELLIGGAILGAFILVLVVELRRQLLAKNVDLTDLDEIIKNILDLEFNKQFFLKLAIGTAIGVFGVLVAFDALLDGQPASENEYALVLYGVGFGLAGNGILKLFTLVPEGLFGVLKLNSEIKALRAENQKLSTALNQGDNNIEEQTSLKK